MHEGAQPGLSALGRVFQNSSHCRHATPVSRECARLGSFSLGMVRHVSCSPTAAWLASCVAEGLAGSVTVCKGGRRALWGTTGHQVGAMPPLGRRVHQVKAPAHAAGRHMAAPLVARNAPPVGKAPTGWRAAAYSRVLNCAFSGKIAGGSRAGAASSSGLTVAVCRMNGLRTETTQTSRGVAAPCSLGQPKRTKAVAPRCNAMHGSIRPMAEAPTR